MPLYGFKLAVGHDNIIGLQGLHQISPPLFKHYWDGDVNVQYFPYESRERDGNRAWKFIGRPYAQVTLDGVTGAERALLHSTFFSTADQCEVTVQLYNTDDEAWIICNGSLERPDPQNDEEPTIGGWRNLRLAIYDLVDLNVTASLAFSSGFDSAAFGYDTASPDDTLRVVSALLALFPDNTSGAITPQDVRDLVVSALGYRTIRTITATATLNSDDDFVIVNVSDGNQVITLPAAASCPGRTITVKRINTSNSFLVVPPTGTIEGSASFAFASQWRTKAFFSDGSVWRFAIGGAASGGY